jgi:arylsulfatase
VPAGRVSDAIFSTVDFVPTIANLAGYDVPKDRIIDGVDQTDLLLGDSEQGARNHHYYLCRNELHAVRKGRWKLLLANRKNYYNYVKDRGSNEIELYDLKSDIGETQNLAGQHPEVVEKLLELAKAFKWPRKLPNTGITAGKKRSQ